LIETVKAGSTQERILDTAERMFADEGYAATSVRKITAKAEVNLAAVHYHFRSKEALLEAVILRRAEPANRERLALLNACELEAGTGQPSLEGVLRAFLKPGFWLRIFCRCSSVLRRRCGERYPSFRPRNCIGG
jgi:AcrR family transcriptional regulator